MHTLDPPTSSFGVAALAPVAPAADAPELTTRELQVVTLLAEGLTNAEIGGRLFLSPRTVQSHLATAMDAFGVRTRTGLAVGAIRAGIVPLFPDERRAQPARTGLRPVPPAARTGLRPVPPAARTGMRRVPPRPAAGFRRAA